MGYTQENRLIAVETPLGEDVLLLEGFTGHEAISRLFSFHLDLLSEDFSIDFKAIVGKKVTVKIKLSDCATYRYLNGYVSSFGQSGVVGRPATNGGGELSFARYRAEIVPWLWFLTRNANCRIFQNMKAPDIIQQVFKDRGFTDFRLSLQGCYSPLEYCVQYRETDFNFVSRLMEHNGIFYFFEHSAGKHVLVLGDKPCAHPPCPYQHEMRFDAMGGGPEEEDVVTAWNTEAELHTGQYSLADYNFETPAADLRVAEPTIISIGDNTKYEVFDYPGAYPAKAHGQSFAKIRMQEQEAAHKVSSGSSICRVFTPGHKFSLRDYYRDDVNTDYVLTEVEHHATVGASYTTGEGPGETYSNQFRCIKADVPFRPPRVTPKPFVQGPQPALVVGKAGEEIWVDQYGRVKVQFYWDRFGKKDENSSCWIRVSSPWAGGGWGSVSIPRIGQEVIVDFLEGDPDRPIIMGRVYNAGQMPPYPLPGMQTRSTLQSRSSKGGNGSNYNEIRMEDLKGQEQLFINAEKDMDHRVEQEYREYVGANRHLIVNASQYELVNSDKHGHVKGKHFEQVESDMSLQVGGNRMESVTGDHSVGISGDRKVSVGGDDSRTVTGDLKETITGKLNLTITGNEISETGGDYARVVNGNVYLAVDKNLQHDVTGHYHVNCTDQVCINGNYGVLLTAEGEGITLFGAPGNFISIGPAGVQIVGTMVLINSGGQAEQQPLVPSPPQTPIAPDQPVVPTAPTDPDTADDGSQGTKLNGGAGGAGNEVASGAGGAGSGAGANEGASGAGSE